MAKVRIVAVKVRQSFYVGDVKELERLIEKGYEVVAATAFGDDTILYTLVFR